MQIATNYLLFLFTSLSVTAFAAENTTPAFKDFSLKVNNCVIPLNANKPLPHYKVICVKNGDAQEFPLNEHMDIKSFRLNRIDEDSTCDHRVEAGPGKVQLDLEKNAILFGPSLESGCYLLLWDKAVSR